MMTTGAMRPRRGPESYLLALLIALLELPIVAAMSVGALLTRAFVAVAGRRTPRGAGPGAA
jgi:hypothetical protein